MRTESAGVVRVANQDSFIDEVNEDLRRDRLYGAFRRYGWIGIAAVLIAVGGASWNEWQKAQARAEAEARLKALDGIDKVSAMMTAPTIVHALGTSPKARYPKKLAQIKLT